MPRNTIGSADICNDLRESLRRFGVAELDLIQCGRGVVLSGISATFYGKQMAQELARKARLVVVSNHIRVQSRQTEGART
ncbi:MAG TPA: hypothetical protein VKD71_15730 [Gemmataceae bacterium]|nr:hypothetical protein [Gemmataceae bacterium]